MNKEKFFEMWQNDELISLGREIEDTWRHGNYILEYFKDSDDNYYCASYMRSGDGEYHGLRENDFELYSVKPVVTTIVKTVYEDAVQIN